MANASAGQRIGFILEASSAGLAGREPLYLRLDREAREKEELDIVRLNTSLQTVEKILSMPQELRAGFITQAEEVAPSLNIGAIMEALGDDTSAAEVAELFKGLGVTGRQLVAGRLATGGAKEVLNGVEQITADADKLDVPRIQRHIEVLAQTLASEPGGQEALAAAQKDGITLGELSELNAQFQVFQPGDLSVIARNLDGFEAFGITAEAGDDADLVFSTVDVGGKKVRIGQNRKTGDVVSRKDFGPEGAEGVVASDLIDASGNVRNEVSSTISAEMQKMLGGTDLATANPDLVTAAGPHANAFLQAEAAAGRPTDISTASAAGIERALEADPKLGEGIPLTSGQRAENMELLLQGEETLREIDRILLTDLAEAVGPQSNISAAINFVTGTASSFASSDAIAFPQTEEARAQLAILQNSITRAIALNPRIPVAEQERIKKLVPPPETFFTAPRQALERLRAVRDHIDRRRSTAGRLLGREIKPIDRMEIIRSLSPREVARIRPEALSIEEIGVLTDEQISRMPSAKLDVLIDRLEQTAPPVEP